MLRCWQKCPDDRPSFEELHVILQEILKKEEVKTLLIDKVKENKKDFDIIMHMEA